MSNKEGCDISVNQSQGCPVPVGNNVCGEANSLEIMKEFNKLYEERMQQVDSEAGGDCLQEKIKLQQEWIRNLTQQNEMLVRAVQELEFEATERVRQLEEKLHKSAQCLCEVMKKYREHDFTVDLLAEPLQKISHLEDDIRNLLEFIRRVRENEESSMDGLFFYNITKEDLLGTKCKYANANKLTKDDTNEGEKLLQEKERTVQELTQKVNYFNSLGDVEGMAKELKIRQEECETLKQAMVDMRQALTEEVALKHDQVIMLRKDYKVLEDRCLQTDKQTAFKEDIIKELRKEIKQLKQQCTQEEISRLNATIEKLQTSLDQTRHLQENEEKTHQKHIMELSETVANLEEDLKMFEEKYERDSKTCKICRGRSKVGFLDTTEVQADLESKESELLKTLNDMKTKMSVEIEKRNNQIQMLKNKVNELESSLNMCEERAANLQEAVTLYSNSMNILECAKEEANNQIEQQKITIANLQQALVDAKQEVDELRRKTQENDMRRQGILSMLENVVQDTEEENEFIKKQSIILNQEHEKLQDLNFTLEVEHGDSLQDIDLLENQVNKYKSLFKENETQTKKLSKQKKCYEEVISYFKHEMGLMADQLNNLQEMLSLSNETAHQESSKIMHAFLEVQTLNEKLSSQLCACEQKNQLETQMNQLHEAKICELQCLIKEKEIDLTKHDQAILNIRKTLNDSLKQNEALQLTIMELNETINQLRGAVNEYEHENCESKRSCLEFQEQISGYCGKLQELKRSLDEKTAESLKLEMAYNNEKRALKSAQQLLQETEKLQQENHKNLVNELEDLKHKLAVSDGNNSKLCQECETLQNQLSKLSRKEAVKDLEIKRYRKIVGDLKSTMMELNSELNKNLAQKELGSSCKNSSCLQNIEQDDSQSVDICINCPCEVEFYQKMVDVLKKSVSDLKRKLIETQQRNKQLEDEMKEKDEELSEAKKAKNELNQKLQEAEFNSKRVAELEREIDQLREELQVKSLQLNDVKRSAQEINGSKCVQLAFAQEEINNLKSEITNILNRQCSLKRENEEMQNQTIQLHCQVTCLGEKNKMYKEQIDQYQIKIRNLTTEKETLIRTNKETLGELKALQCMTNSVDKQKRVTTDSLKQLEADIEDLKNNKEEICLESKNVIKNVRAWITEQKRINSLVAKREREFMETIKKLNYDKEMSASQQQTPTKPTCKSTKCRNMTNSPCSLGSQGTASFYDGESPPLSPDYGVNEWYSSTFRSESENDSEEDYCVNTLENLTHEMKKSNKIWLDEKNTRRDCRMCNKGTKETK